MAVVPDKALTIAVTKRTLYEEKPPLVGVGLVYKPHYISTMPFSTAYMHLNVWHSAGSNQESEDPLGASCLLFVNISEMSDVIPVAARHPILLDVASKEATEGTGEPMSPFSFRGFRLHTVWMQQPRGELADHIPFPHFLGESNSSLLEYESEKFPQSLRQGQKIVLGLKPPPPHQRPLEHCFGPHPPYGIGGLQAATQGQAGGQSWRRKVHGGKGVSNRGTYSWGVSST